MTRKKWTLWVLVAAVVGFIGLQTIDRFLYIHPTPNTQSAFLRTYAPKETVQRFIDKQQTSSATYSEQSSGGWKFASHQRAFGTLFVISSKDWMPLMSALQEDISSRLTGQGAQVLYQTGDARQGFHFDYKAGKTMGDVTVEPLKIDRTLPVSCAPETACGEIGVELHIVIHEKWFRTEPGAMSLRIDNLSMLR